MGPKCVEGYQLLPSPGICLLPASTQPPPRGLSSIPFEASANIATVGLQPSPRAAWRALVEPRRPTPEGPSDPLPGNRSECHAGPGARRSPSPEPGREEGPRLQPPRGSLTAIPGGDARWPLQLLSEARALTPRRRKAPRPPAGRGGLVFQVPAEARPPRALRPWGVPPDAPSRPRLT